MTTQNPHMTKTPLTAGADPERAKRACILLHGRSGTAGGVMELGRRIDDGATHFLAPEAQDNTWYPERFTAPVESNEPWLGHALAAIDNLVIGLSQQGFAPAQIVIAGFSQGASLTAEYALRHPQRFAGLLILTGGAIGETVPWAPAAGSLAGTPALITGSHDDNWVPARRVRETEDLLRRQEANVMELMLTRRGHKVSEAEILLAKHLLAGA